MLMMTVLGSVC